MAISCDAPYLRHAAFDLLEMLLPRCCLPRGREHNKMVTLCLPKSNSCLSARMRIRNINWPLIYVRNNISQALSTRSRLCVCCALACALRLSKKLVIIINRKNQLQRMPGRGQVFHDVRLRSCVFCFFVLPAAAAAAAGLKTQKRQTFAALRLRIHEC